MSVLDSVNAVAETATPAETTEYLYIYPNGFFPDRRSQVDVGDVVVDTGDSGLTPSDVLTPAATDGDDLVILKLTRVAGLIARVEFLAAVSGPGNKGDYSATVREPEGNA